MHGPRAPTTPVAPLPRMASTAASTTPPVRPRHPACTAANTPSALPRAMEPQSAVSTATADTGPSLTRASPSPANTAVTDASDPVASVGSPESEESAEPVPRAKLITSVP